MKGVSLVTVIGLECISGVILGMSPGRWCRFVVVEVFFFWGG